MVAFNYLFLHSNDQIDPYQIIECEMNKQDHIESFVVEGVHKMSIGFSMGVNSTCGSRNDYGQLTNPDYGSFGLPSSIEKTNDQVCSSFIIVDIIFIFLFWIYLWEF